jgi:hypothetical protein
VILFGPARSRPVLSQRGGGLRCSASSSTAERHRLRARRPSAYRQARCSSPLLTYIPNLTEWVVIAWSAATRHAHLDASCLFPKPAPE